MEGRKKLDFPYVYQYLNFNDFFNFQFFGKSLSEKVFCKIFLQIITVIIDLFFLFLLLFYLEY